MSMVLMDERNHRIGENIRKYRLLKGLTQDELAEGLCSVSQLSKVENGKTYLKRSLLKQMADRLGVTIDRIETADAVLDELSEDLQLAKDASVIQNYHKSLEIACQVAEKCREFGYQDLQLEAMFLQCQAYTELHLFDSTIAIGMSALEENDFSSSTQKVLFLYEVGHAYEQQGHRMLAFDYYTRAGEEFENAECNWEIRYRVYFSLSRINFLMSNNRAGLRIVEKAIQVAAAHSKHLWRIRSTYMKATFLRRLGDVERAEKIFLSALKEAEDNAYLLDVAIINNNMGNLFQDSGEYGQAFVHFNRAVQVYELLNEELYLCASLLHLAELANIERKFERAYQLIDRVLEIVDRIQVNTYSQKARAYRVRGWVKASQDQFDAYVADLEQSLEIYDQYQVVFEAYDVAKELADALYQKGENRAVEMYRKAVEYNERNLNLTMRR